MKLKLCCTLVISMSVFLVSCRDQETIIENNAPNVKQDLTSQLKKDSVFSFETEPKDPPIKGTHWRITK